MKTLMILVVSTAFLAGPPAWEDEASVGPVTVLPVDPESLLDILDRMAPGERPDPWFPPFACGGTNLDVTEVRDDRLA